MNNRKSTKRADLQRRRFLQGTLATGAGVMMASAMPASAAEAEEGRPTESAEKKKGYRLTKHILAYYDSAAS